MRCSKCGNPLPGNGVSCTFCGAMMSQEQISKNMQDNIKENKRIELLSEKYGQHNKIEYREEKESNKALYAAIAIIVLFLIIVAVVMFLLRK